MMLTCVLVQLFIGDVGRGEGVPFGKICSLAYRQGVGIEKEIGAFEEITTHFISIGRSEPGFFNKDFKSHHVLFIHTLSHIKSLHTAGRREKFNSPYFPETENGRGFDSRLNTRRCVSQLVSELSDLYSCNSIFLLKLIDPVVVPTRFINRADKLLNSHSPDSIGIFRRHRFHEEWPRA